MRRDYTTETVKFIGRDMEADMRPVVDLFLFAVAMRIHAKLASLTPVDTGYLRLTLAARVVGTALPYEPPEKVLDTPGAYTGKWTAADSAAYAAIGAFHGGQKIEFGYTAEYAPFVEDLYHMVKTTKAAVPQIVSDAKTEARKGLQ